MAGPSRASARRASTTLLRTIVGQQVSVAAARSMWNKLEALVGSPPDLEVLLKSSDEELRAAGLSRQKAGYARSLAGLVLSGELDLANLPEDDEEAIALLTKIKGIGRWSAEIYLLFSEGRPDVWPAGDLAVQIEIGKLMGLEGSPLRKAIARTGRSLAPPPRRRRDPRLAQLQLECRDGALGAARPTLCWRAPGRGTRAGRGRGGSAPSCRHRRRRGRR